MDRDSTIEEDIAEDQSDIDFHMKHRYGTEVKTIGGRVSNNFPIPRAIVLGAREGNIGGAIAQRLCLDGWMAQEDDCYRAVSLIASENSYEAPPALALAQYDACVITLGVTHMEPFSEVSEDNLHKVLFGSLELPLECARRYVRARKAFVHRSSEISDDDPHSVIVFIGSYAHEHPFTHCTSYCVAKAGLDMAVRSLAWELMPEIDVHIIHPHHVQGTPMTDEVLKGMQKGVHKMGKKDALEYQRKDLRMPDLLKPDEIASMVVWLLTNPTARWLSGNSLRMYGGVR